MFKSFAEFDKAFAERAAEHDAWRAKHAGSMVDQTTKRSEFDKAWEEKAARIDAARTKMVQEREAFEASQAEIRSKQCDLRAAALTQPSSMEEAMRLHQQHAQRAQELSWFMSRTLGG